MYYDLFKHYLNLRTTIEEYMRQHLELETTKQRTAADKRENGYFSVLTDKAAADKQKAGKRAFSVLTDEAAAHHRVLSTIEVG